MSDLSGLAAALADRYRIEGELGEGGMATVYLARDLKHDRDVAIKVLKPELAAVLGADRFVQEIATTAQLQHPNILPLFDSGTADGFLYYVMPYVEGESLRYRLDRERQLGVDEAVKLVVEVADALQYAHEHGVVHRDIKPENILLHAGRPMVADFGIALAVQQAGGQRLTQTGMSLGTPQYMSPEQAMGERTIDARTDIYALGVITYEMLAGEAPFAGVNARAIVAKVLTEKPQPLADLRDTVPAPVAAAVHQALQRLPADRFARAADFAAALQRDVPTPPPASAGARPGRTWKSRGLLFAVLAPVVALALVAGFAVGRGWNTSRGEWPTRWVGEPLGGSGVAVSPVVSPDGQLVAFVTLVDGVGQVCVLKPETGDWKVLSRDTTRGVVVHIAWGRDNSRIYFDRVTGAPNGVYSISPLGSDERLVLADAWKPDVLPDGSLLVSRLNADRMEQLYHYHAETGRLDTLEVVAPFGFNRFLSAFPDGRGVVVYGRAVAQKDSADHLYALDLASGSRRRLAPDSDFVAMEFATAPDNRWVVVTLYRGGLTRIVAVPRDGSNRTRELAFFTPSAEGISVGPDHSIYATQTTGLGQLIQYSPADGTIRSRRVPTIVGLEILALPDGRILAAVRAPGGTRVMAIAQGQDPVPFVGTAEPTGQPLALLGKDQVALAIGRGEAQTVAIASAATGQIVRRLPGIFPTTMSGSPDGRTLYYTEQGVVWSVASTGGAPHRIRKGDAVSVAPDGTYLIVEVDDTTGMHLVHVPLDGSPERDVPVHSEMRLAVGAWLTARAVAPDGRILVKVARPSSWFWPLAILDPRTGHLQVLPPGFQMEMNGGWADDGSAVYYGVGLESRLWRFRPAKAGERTP